MAEKYVFRGNTYRRDAELQAWSDRHIEAPLEPDLPIIDPHHHLWDDQRGRYFLDAFLHDIEQSGHNIVATVFIECVSMWRGSGPEDEQPIGEVEFANGMAAISATGRYGRTRACAGIIGHVDLRLGDRARPVLEKLIAAGNGRLKGIRHGVCWDVGDAAKYGRHQYPRYLLLDPTFQKGFACVQEAGLVYEAWQFHPQLPDVSGLMREFPEANVVVDHTGGVLGLPPHDGDRNEVFKAWRESIRDLAQFPNLKVKLGGLGMLYSGWDFHLRPAPPSSEEIAAAWRPYIETCIDAFGPSRCIMESNFPVDKQSCGYGVLWNAMKRITRNCSAADKAAMYHDTAQKTYQLTF